MCGECKSFPSGVAVVKKFWGVFVLSVVCGFGSAVQSRDAVRVSTEGWSGLYIGAHGGFLRGKNHVTNVATVEPEGTFGGLQAGYWAPLTANWLYGFEVDLSLSDADGIGNAAGVFSGIDRFGTARTRLGYANGPWLLFASGGLAWARMTSLDITTSAGTMNTKHSFLGWSGGFGVEYALSQRWSAKAEYVHASFTRNNEDLVGEGGEQKLGFGTVRLGINYQLGVLPQRPMPMRAPANFDWTGGYIGVHGGFARGVQSMSYQGGTVLFDPASGGFGGVQGGYNFQFASNLALGIESDFSFANLNGNFMAGCCRVTVERFGTARLRAGYALGNVLVYGTGGVAWAKFDPTYVGGQFESNRPFVGWTGGFGAEYAFAPLWTIKAEYLRFAFDDTNTEHPGLSQFDERGKYDVYRIGLNYRTALLGNLLQR